MFYIYFVILLMSAFASFISSEKRWNGKSLESLILFGNFK